jgi:hypothetical protein
MVAADANAPENLSVFASLAVVDEDYVYYSVSGCVRDFRGFWSDVEKLFERIATRLTDEMTARVDRTLEGVDDPVGTPGSFAPPDHPSTPG